MYEIFLGQCEQPCISKFGDVVKLHYFNPHRRIRPLPITHPDLYDQPQSYSLLLVSGDSAPLVLLC